jgi:hypothetical protein
LDAREDVDGRSGREEAFPRPTRLVSIGRERPEGFGAVVERVVDLCERLDTVTSTGGRVIVVSLGSAAQAWRGLSPTATPTSLRY